MKVFFHDDFYQVYTSEPAAEQGRMESIVRAISPIVSFKQAIPAAIDEIELAHTRKHIAEVKSEGLYDIAALAAGATIQAAKTGLTEPSFALVRPPGHHASSDSCWGFCYFSNMAIAMLVLKNEGLIQTALVLDIDLHFGDGTANILDSHNWAKIYNPPERRRDKYMQNTARLLSETQVDIIGISAGFDHHVDDWGKMLETDDYYSIGAMVKATAKKSSGGYFAVLEGGYNHAVLGQNARALIEGMM